MEEIEKQYPIEKDKALSKKTKKFLSAFNAPKSTATVNLSVTDARKAFADLQASVEVDYSGTEESELNLDLVGYKIKLNILRPANSKGTLPFFCFHPWWRLGFG